MENKKEYQWVRFTNKDGTIDTIKTNSEKLKECMEVLCKTYQFINSQKDVFCSDLRILHLLEKIESIFKLIKPFS